MFYFILNALHFAFVVCFVCNQILDFCFQSSRIYCLIYDIENKHQPQFKTSIYGSKKASTPPTPASPTLEVPIQEEKNALPMGCQAERSGHC